MLITTDITSRHPTPAVLTIGTFDGVHVGHQELMRGVVASARRLGVAAVAMTFDPLPREVLRPDQPVAHVTRLSEKLRLLDMTGLDETVVVPFTRELAATSPRDFIESVRRYLPFVELWEGEGFALGRDRAGTVEVLEQLGEELGFKMHPSPLVEVDGEPVSSTRVREAIMSGDMAGASRLLGRYTTVPGTVVPGSKRGRDMGYPTANLALPPNLALPADGVYATWATRHATGEVLPSITSVGTRPTFEDDARLVEVFIMDYSATLYGETLTAHFVHFLRPQVRFEGIEPLVEQMRKDEANTRETLRDSEPPSWAEEHEPAHGASA